MVRENYDDVSRGLAVYCSSLVAPSACWIPYLLVFRLPAPWHAMPGVALMNSRLARSYDVALHSRVLAVLIKGRSPERISHSSCGRHTIHVTASSCRSFVTGQKACHSCPCPPNSFDGPVSSRQTTTGFFTCRAHPWREGSCIDHPLSVSMADIILHNQYDCN